jgi:glycosyltransferase involved in cell wall biosynthesis
MKILIYDTSARGSGAYNAALALHKGLIKQRVKSFFFSQFGLINKNKKDLDYFKKKIIHRINIIKNNFLLRKYKKKNILFSNTNFFYSDVFKTINKIKPDIVHLNWVAQGNINLKKIFSLEIPIVITMQDYWFFTGGCHYTLGCKKYEKYCSNCHILNSNIKKDISYKNFNEKKKLFVEYKKNFEIVVVSQNMKKRAEKSFLFKKKKINVIGNTFTPLNLKRINKKNDSDKIKLLYVGQITPAYKNFKILKNILSFLNPKKFKILVAGDKKETITAQTKDFNIDVINLGYISDKLDLNNLYFNSDILLVTSKEEAFGLVALESLYNGTPVVAFKNTGLEDLIDHKINGYLANENSPKNYADGIQWIINNKHKLNKRDFIEKTNLFENSKIVEKYKKIYKELI